MGFSSGKESVCLEDILNKVTEADILAYYLGVYNIPCVINSPLRRDNHPSFGLYSLDGIRIFYTDLSTKEKGGLFDLLMKLWSLEYADMLIKIYRDIPKFSSEHISIKRQCTIRTSSVHTNYSDLQCKIRDWKQHDIEYWESFGISLEWLKYGEVYPISHKIVLKDNERYVFGADKYAYAYVERKEGRITLKIYQPFNKSGYKWSNKHDASVISLWTKVPEYGEQIIICSSLKDALCLWSNVRIPCIAVQGEGYNISDTAISELKRRYKKVYILFDNDEVGILDSKKLAERTGFINLTLPEFEGGKDVSDLYKKLNNKEEFIKIIKKTINYEKSIV